MSFDEQSPVKPLSSGREVTTNAILSVPSIETELVYPEENTTKGTLGTFNAGANRWAFPPGIYIGVCELHLEHNSYPDLFEKVTVRLHVGPGTKEHTAELNATNPGRTIFKCQQFVQVTEDAELYTTIQGDTDGRVQVLPSSKTRFVKLWELSDFPNGFHLSI